MSKAYFKNSKPDFEKRVYVLLGHSTTGTLPTHEISCPQGLPLPNCHLPGRVQLPVMPGWMRWHSGGRPPGFTFQLGVRLIPSCTLRPSLGLRRPSPEPSVPTAWPPPTPPPTTLMQGGQPSGLGPPGLALREPQALVHLPRLQLWQVHQIPVCIPSHMQHPRLLQEAYQITLPQGQARPAHTWGSLPREALGLSVKPHSPKPRHSSPSPTPYHLP